MPDEPDFSVPGLGTCSIPSPIILSTGTGDSLADYVRDDELVRYDVIASAGPQKDLESASLLQKAGPRQNIYFSPSHVHAGIVTCGGLCPGINDVIRAVVRCLWFRYGVRRITGIRYGYRGFLPEFNIGVRTLDPEAVDEIHKVGGTYLGSSRGGGDRTSDIVDSIERLNLNILFTIGGDGTQKGALDIAEEIERRNLKIAVVGIPKTIDNDLLYVDKTFGFETAVARAAEAVSAAHVEAHSAMNGIGLVKVMGRESGFIAVHTVLAVHEANFVLIPEVPFELEGPNGFLRHLEDRLARRSHAVVVVAEGAGQEFLQSDGDHDASGNVKLSDVGVYLRDRIASYFKKKGIDATIKYIDPSYMVRSSPAIPTDSVYCERLGNNAVHAAMAGKTRILIGMVHGQFVHIPIRDAVASRNHVSPEGSLWRDAVDATQQPFSMVNPR
ncbi:MAG TPA: ATP-dependent 6-phosphofructokinase [Rectinemataceae bacterium]|nr:ATP-dependent 6-phosphofructokinase [Rectinemataceae bacterium]